MQPHLPLAKDTTFIYHWDHSPSKCSLRRQETTPRQRAELGGGEVNAPPAGVWGLLSLPKATDCPASSREAPKSFPLFLNTGQGDSAIPGQEEIGAGRVSTPRLCKSDIQDGARWSSPRPGPGPSSFIPGRSPPYSRRRALNAASPSNVCRSYCAQSLIVFKSQK